MSFLTFYFSAVIAAGLAAYASLPGWRWVSWRCGLVDEPGHRKIHAAPIPLAGGLAVMTGLLLPLGIAALVLNSGWIEGGWLAPLQHGFSRRSTQMGAIFLGAIGMFTVGLLDDKLELKPALKFCGQLLPALLVAASGIRITLFVHNDLFSYMVTVLWILTVTNAFNFMDNMNGLCSGLGAIAAWCFAWGAAIQGQYLVALLGCLSGGALLGFLPWNFPRADAFLGDAGSHLVGYWLAVLAILPHFYTVTHPSRWAVLSPLLILGVPLADLGWVVLLRWRLGKPFYVGDTNHLSHRLERRGLSKTTAVLVIWLLAAVCGSLAVFLLA